MEDNKVAPSAPPPWGSCCLPFGKDFLCFGMISGAHPKAFPPSFFWGLSTLLVFPNLMLSKPLPDDNTSMRTRPDCLFWKKPGKEVSMGNALFLILDPPIWPA